MQPAPVVSPDGYWMWNGTQWVPNTTAPAPAAVVATSVPVSAQAPVTSPDGLWIWNGAQWVPNAFRSIFSYESAGFRAMMATLFICVNVVGILLFMTFDVLDGIRLEQGGPASGTLFLIEGFIAIFGLIGYYGGFIPAVVFFVMWVHRVVRNMPSLGAVDPRFTPGAAVAWCFVPFVNLVQPFFSVLDAWRGSIPAHRWLDRAARRAGPVPSLVAGWWAAWLGARLLTWIGYLMTQSSDTTVKVEGTFVDVFGNGVLVLAAALAILVVRRLTAQQDRRNQLIASGQLA